MRPQGGIDADHLRIGLAVQQTGKAVEGIAADADAGRGRPAVLLVEQDSQRQMEGMQAIPGETLGQR